MTDMIDIPDLASDLSATAMLIIKSNDPNVHGELQEAFAAALAPFEAENKRLREALEWLDEKAKTSWNTGGCCSAICFRVSVTARAALLSTEPSHDD